MRDVAVDVRVLLVDQAEIGGLAGEVVVLLGQLQLAGRRLDDRPEAGNQLVARRTPEILGDAVVTTGEDGLGILQRHPADGIGKDGQGFGDGVLRRMIHRFDQLIGLLAHAEHAQGRFGIIEIARQRNLHLLIAEETILLPQRRDREFSPLGQCLAHPGTGIGIADTVKRPGLRRQRGKNQKQRQDRCQPAGREKVHDASPK
ncbi:hypothetical protein SDC9_191070 [bioreactor metagenome]|uniref:Uncharacterized protein n=1 Tax=bioreactor metagenome TaxID=1076179 RepID=A0A645HXB2_9ZZZZ